MTDMIFGGTGPSLTYSGMQGNLLTLIDLMKETQEVVRATNDLVLRTRLRAAKPPSDQEASRKQR
jgi:hypothetical protein